MAGLFFALLFMIIQYQGEAKSSVTLYTAGCMMTMAGVMVLTLCYGVGNYGRNKTRRITYQLLLLFTYLGTFFGALCVILYNVPDKYSLAIFIFSLEGCTTAAAIFLICIYDQTYFDIKKKDRKEAKLYPVSHYARDHRYYPFKQHRTCHDKAFG